jgi:chromosome segregation ATPase
MLAEELAAAQRVLSTKKSTRSAADQALAEERAARQAAEHALQHSKDANAKLAPELENPQASLVATYNKLESKSKALDFQVICVDEVVLQLKNTEGRLNTAKEDLKTQGKLLKSAQQALSNREGSSNTMISLAVAHTATLFKNHLPDLDMELLRQDFTVDDVEREALVSNAFNATQDFVSSYDFASLVESDDNDSPKSL